MNLIDYVLDAIAHHPKLSQGIAWTTTGVSGAVQYAEHSLGMTPDNWSKAGIIIGVIASVVVVYANIRRIIREERKAKLDNRLVQLQIEKLEMINREVVEEQKKRRREGEPMRRKTDI